jgi:pimeloyl-ACP methyl ester carboxylesterase
MTIRFLVCIGLCFSLFFQWVGHIQAAETDLTVVGNVTLTLRSEPYYFTNITVEDGAVLHIDPGVRIQLAAGATISVHGSVIANGTEVQPIVLTGSVSDPWNQMHIFPEGYASFLNVDFDYFSQEILVENSSSAFDFDTFKDGKRNLILVKNTNPSKSLSYGNLTFINKDLGGGMEDNGMLFEGNFTDINLHDFSFQDPRLISQKYIIGIRVLGVTSTLEGNQIWFGNCPSTSTNDLVSKLINVFINLKYCATKPIPTVFIPGYGTSIDLARLANPDDHSISSNWHFVDSITPAYTHFLADLNTNQIQYQVAHYDWRLHIEEIVKSYLLPAIDRAKAISGSSKVHLVGHSYGGLVARQYIQGSAYRNDVASLVELGTPNLGAAKAYSVWQAGILPDDWSALENILRWYEYWERASKLSRTSLIHTYFPSVKDLLPIYPAIKYGNSFEDPHSFVQLNTTLFQLASSLSLLTSRVHVYSFYSSSEPTLEQLVVRGPPVSSNAIWQDGEPAIMQPNLEARGDGTVPVQSVALPSFSNTEVVGEHSLLPQVASAQVIHLLYPQLPVHSGPQKQNEAPHWFVFDCPIQVTITLPNGEKRSSDQQDGIGEVEKSDQLLWMFLPDQVGEYQIDIQALADTDVRFWVDAESVQMASLKKDEHWKTIYTTLRPQSPPSLPVEVSSNAEQSVSKVTFSLTLPHLSLLNFFYPAWRDTQIARQAIANKRYVAQEIGIQKQKSQKKIWPIAALISGIVLLILLAKRRE